MEFGNETGANRATAGRAAGRRALRPSSPPAATCARRRSPPDAAGRRGTQDPDPGRRRPIGVGERLSAETVEWQDWPEGAVRPEYITIAAMPDALDQLAGAVARFEIFPGEPILEQKLVHSDQGYLSAVLEKGKRGVSIAVSAASASAASSSPTTASTSS